jgi:hypothetical protein
MLIVDPIRAKPRTLIMEPKWKASNNERVDPKVVTPYIEIVLPQRQKPRTLTADPMWSQSRTDVDEASLAAP